MFYAHTRRKERNDNDKSKWILLFLGLFTCRWDIDTHVRSEASQVIHEAEPLSVFNFAQKKSKNRLPGTPREWKTLRRMDHLSSEREWSEASIKSELAMKFSWSPFFCASNDAKKVARVKNIIAKCHGHHVLLRNAKKFLCKRRAQKSLRLSAVCAEWSQPLRTFEALLLSCLFWHLLFLKWERENFYFFHLKSKA